MSNGNSGYSEFSKASDLGRKAEKFLGLGASLGNSTPVQREGYLYKKPLTGSKDGSWQKRYFVLKDSFLLYYDAKPIPAGTFNMRPKGVFPLAGAHIFPNGKEGNASYLFEVAQMSTKNKAISLSLKVDDKAEADDWIKALGEGSRATFENAMVGRVQLQRIKSVGTAMERTMQQALDKIAASTRELEEQRALRFKTMMDHMQQQQEHDMEVNAKHLETMRLAHEVEQVERELDQQKLAKLTEEQLAREVETRLLEAKKQIVQLAAALKQKQHEFPDLFEANNLAMSLHKIEQFLVDNT